MKTRKKGLWVLPLAALLAGIFFLSFLIGRYRVPALQVLRLLTDRFLSLISFGRLLAQHGHTLVYGGGAQGVMGAAARGAYEAGGKITGIAPTFLQVDGILFDHCTEFLLTDTMAERKTAMIAHADAFVMAPGGFGTLEEFFEVLTLKQLGRHNPAIAVLNTGGFYDSLQSFVRSAVERRFIRPACLQIYALLPTPEETLAYLEQYDAAALDVRHLKNI